MKILFLIILSLNSLAQDEWFFKDMLDGEITLPKDPPRKKHFIAEPRTYSFDISGDGINEFLKFQFVDGLTYFKLFNHRKEFLYEYKFEIKGFDARPYKLIKKNISNTQIATLIFFFEGKTGYLEKQGSSSIYVGVAKIGEVSSYSLQKLTSVWFEFGDGDSYIRRPYEYKFEDVNNDGLLEIIVYSGKVQRIFFLGKDGRWTDE